MKTTRLRSRGGHGDVRSLEAHGVIVEDLALRLYVRDLFQRSCTIGAQMCVSRMLPQQLAMRGKVGWVDPSVCNAAEVVAARNGNGRGQSGCSLGSRTQKSVVTSNAALMWRPHDAPTRRAHIVTRTHAMLSPSLRYYPTCHITIAK